MSCLHVSHIVISASSLSTKQGRKTRDLERKEDIPPILPTRLLTIPTFAPPPSASSAPNNRLCSNAWVSNKGPKAFVSNVVVRISLVTVGKASSSFGLITPATLRRMWMGLLARWVARPAMETGERRSRRWSRQGRDCRVGPRMWSAAWIGESAWTCVWDGAEIGEEASST